MSNSDKQVLCVPQRKKHNWGQAVMHTCDFCDHYEMTITTEDGEHSCANCCDAEYVGALTCALEMTIERAEAAEKRIAELEAREVQLPPTIWYDFDGESQEIAVLEKRLVEKALSEAGVKFTAGTGKGDHS